MTSYLRRAAFLVLATIACGCRTPASSPEEPNVLVIVVDTLRADRLGIYGAQRDTTPNLAVMAAEGVVFERAFTTAPSTWQAFTSMLTGVNPPRHGVRFIYDDPLAPEIDTLASLLARRGYDTAAFDPIPFMREMTGNRAFATYVDSETLKRQYVTDDEIIDHMLEWIEVRRGKPWFAFVRLNGPHWPYRPREEFHDLFAPGPDGDHSFNEGNYGVRLERDESGRARLQMTDLEAYQKLVFDVDFPPGVREHMLAHYDACVRTSDETVGRALEALRDGGRLDAAVVVVTSDHGEAFGETGYRGHSIGLEEFVIRVPMLWRFPTRHRHGTKGQRVAQVARTIDIVPTVLDVLDVEPPAGLDGRSLLPAIDDGKDLALVAYAETDNPPIAVLGRPFIEGVAGKQRMLREERWKLVYTPGPVARWQLFDMQAAGEAADVGAAHPQELARLQQAMQAILDTDSEIGSAGRRPLSEEERERMRALGYQ